MIDDLSFKKTRRGLSVYTSNPFVCEVQTSTRRVTNKAGDMMLVSSETGEIQSKIAGFWKTQEVDSTKFVKLFTQGVKALTGLSQTGIRVFEILHSIMQDNIGKDIVYISYSFINKLDKPMSNPTYDRGMRELIEKGFIAASNHQGLFWINPNFIWNGDRLAFVQEYKLKVDTDIKDICND